MEHFRQAKLFFNMDIRALDVSRSLSGTTHAMLDEFGLEEAQLVLELSERQPLESPHLLRPYKHQGMRVAVDNFGCGFTGMNILYLAEPDFLKIDRSLIDPLVNHAKTKLLLSQLVNVAHLLGVMVVAVGVETERDYYACKDIGCDLIQGFLIQQPTCDPSAIQSTYPVIEALGQKERRLSLSDQHIIADQITQLQPIPLSSSMEDVFERFRTDKSCTFFPVVDSSHQPLGIVREEDLKDYTYSQYGKALMSNKAFGRKLSDFVVRCPMADMHAKAEQILQAYSALERSEGIIMVDTMRYAGFLSAQSLLRVINEKNLNAARDQNPLTKLPGNNLIHEYVSETLSATDLESTLVYFDFDNFKPFNDKYGFRLGDRAILLFAELLSKALPHDSAFPAHVGGDDFFGGFRGLDFQTVQSIVSQLIETFRADVESFYDDKTRTLGFIIAQDRLGNVVSFPLMGVSAVVLHLPAGRPVYSVDDVSGMIACLKKDAKSAPDRMAAASMIKDPAIQDRGFLPD
jgi:diguanylate cyclase (GGDEF)-like protein